MAAFEFVQALEKRQQQNCRLDRYGNCVDRSPWYWWGRWVLAAVVVGLTLLTLMLCMNARRRKRRGAQPFYGTGWMGRNNKHNQQGTYAYNQQYNGQQQGYAGYPQQGADGSYAAPPPAYGQAQQNPQYTGTTFNPNDGYYGGHSEGIQLQQPQSSYQRDAYQPPAGPPPGK